MLCGFGKSRLVRWHKEWINSQLWKSGDLSDRPTRPVQIGKVTLTFVLGLGLWFLGGLVLGCEGRPEPSLPGVSCYRAQECARGLICFEGICTSDVESSVPEGAGTPLQLPEREPAETPDGGVVPDSELDAG